MNKLCDTCGCHTSSAFLRRCTSWSGIAIGALVGLGFSFLLTLFSIATSLIVFHTTEAGVTTVAIGGFIGMVIGTIVTTFVSGWVSGRASSHCNCHREYGFLYGFATWCLALGVMIVMAAPVSHYISNYYRALINPNAVLSFSSTTPHSGIVAQPVSANIANTAQNKTTSDQSITKTSGGDLGVSLFLTFILFFLGAISSSLGGYVGFKPKHYVEPSSNVDQFNKPSL